MTTGQHGQHEAVLKKELDANKVEYGILEMRLGVIEQSNCKSTRFPGIETQCQDKVIAYWCRIVSAVPAARNLVPWNPSTAQRYIHSHDAAFSLVLESRYVTANITIH
jgi:hypothetical protein